jgi:hypothetical protein
MSKRLENGQKLIEEVQKYKDWKFDSILLTDESCWWRKFNLRKKSPKSDVYEFN